MSTKYADFCLKKIMLENNLLSQSVVEDGKNGKNDYVWKIMPCQFFQVSLKKIQFHTNPCIRKTAWKIRIFWCNGVFFTQNFVIKLEKIYQDFPDFNYNLQQYSLFYSLFLYGVTIWWLSRMILQFCYKLGAEGDSLSLYIAVCYIRYI